MQFYMFIFRYIIALYIFTKKTLFIFLFTDDLCEKLS
jgi:hypothetical protein